MGRERLVGHTNPLGTVSSMESHEKGCQHAGSLFCRWFRNYSIGQVWMNAGSTLPPLMTAATRRPARRSRPCAKR